MKRSVLSVCFLAALAFARPGYAATITFEALGIGPGTSNIIASAVSDGFQFTSPSNHLHDVNQATTFADSGSTNLFIHDNGGSNAGNFLTMSQVGGGLFSLSSASLSEGFIGFGAASVRVVGNFSGGGTITLELTLDGIIDSVGGAADFQLFNFGAPWTNLSSVTFTGLNGTANEHAFSIDNITVNQTAAVPEPATLALVSVGALGLLVHRRRLKQ